jgi:hypothetical protein
MAIPIQRRGTTPPPPSPNTLISYPPGSVNAPSSVIAWQTGYKNTSSNTANHQVPQ